MFKLSSFGIESHKKLFDLAKNVGWIFFDKIFRILSSLLVGVWIARYLGPAQFGLMNYISVFPLMLTALAGMGLTNILFNEFLNTDDDTIINKIFLSSISIKLLSGIIAFVCIFIISLYTNSDRTVTMLIAISATSLIIQSLDVVDVYFQSKKAVKYSIIPKFIVFIIATCVRIIGIWYKADLIFFVTVTSLELFVSSLLTFIIYGVQSKFRIFRFNIDFVLIKRLLKLSWPLMLSELFLFLYVRIDLLMIKQFSTTIELGNYSVTMRITDLWYFIPIAITTGLSPSIISLRQIDYKSYIKRYEYLLDVLVGISLSIGCFVTLTADYIIEVLYGSQYNGVGKILSINIWTGLFVFLAIGSDKWFIIENKQKFVLYRTIMGAIFNVCLNFILIPAFGAFGASIATLIAQISASYLINGIYPATREIFILQTKAIFFLPLFVKRLIMQTL